MKREVKPGGSYGQFYDRFDSIEDVLNHIQNAPHVTSRRASQKTSMHYGDGGESWDLNAGFEGTLKLARDGWKDGRDKANVLANALYDQIAQQMFRPEVVFDVYGDGGFDMGRVMVGEPEAFFREEENESQLVAGPSSRVVTIYVNVCTSAAVDAKVMWKRGAVVAALVDLLEQGGKRVEVFVGSCQSSGDSRHEWLVKVKEAGRPLNLDSVAFWVAHPGVLRRIGFAVNETLPQAAFDGIMGFGYGMPDSFRSPREENSLYIDKMLLGAGPWDTPEGAIRWLKEELKKQGLLTE